MLPATTKKQREPMYRDLTRLLSPGFLSTTIRYNGISIGIRSLQSSDFDLLKVPAKENADDWPMWVAAASVWMLDGYPLLECYPTSTRFVYDALMKAHKGLVKAIFTRTISFFARIKRANMVLESYLYEDESRRLWKSAKINPQIVLFGSYPGVDRLGTNSYQNVWFDWNQQEDNRIEDETSWSYTKVLVSAQAPKGAKKLDAKDKSRLDQERTRRIEAQDRAYYKWMGVIGEDDRVTGADSSTDVFQPRTPEELIEEMRRWVAGEKDFHDQVIDDYKNRVKKQVEEREADQQRVLQEAQERRRIDEAASGFTRPSLVAYTPEQLSKVVPERARPGAKFIIEANPVARTYNRYLRDDPNSGALKVDGGRVVVYRDHSGEEETPRPSLNDLVAGRKPGING